MIHLFRYISLVALGLVLSSVYRIVAPVVSQVMVTRAIEAFVPLSGLNFGVATCPGSFATAATSVNAAIPYTIRRWTSTNC